MTEIVVAQRMWQRRDSAANWTLANPVLNAGEIGVELGVVGTMQKFKVGDGVTAWSALPYYEPKEVVTAIPIVAGVATMNCALGRFFTLNLNVNATLAITNPPGVDCMILKVTPSAGAILTLPGSVTMLGGAPYATGALVHVLGLMTLNTGTSYDATVSPQ